MKNTEKELEDLFQEMFGKEGKPEKPELSESQWKDPSSIPFEEKEKESLYKPTGLPCDTCGSKDATYSKHYKGQWCVNCWF